MVSGSSRLFGCSIGKSDRLKRGVLIARGRFILDIVSRFRDIEIIVVNITLV